MCAEYHHNALIICNHVPTPGEGGGSRKNDRGFGQSLPRQCGGNIWGLLCIVKEGHEMKNSRLPGKSSDFLPTSSPRGDSLDQKSKSPLFTGDGGGAVTNEKCITISVHNHLALQMKSEMKSA